MALPDAHGATTHDDLSRGALAFDWQRENQRGLALARAGSWPDAATSFAAAVNALNERQHRDPSAHHGLALVLSNLAQACFRAGRTDEAIQHAQRACAVRVALSGEDAVTTARARSDLAVLLASTGRAGEAPALLTRAIAAVEQSVGDEDACLAPLLENAARASLALSQPASAEPQLLRLHALLAAHDQPTDRADRLLERVLEARQVEAVKSAIESQAAAPLPVSPLVDDAAEWEDQPLRDAVQLTDTLLRTTPTGVPVIRAPEEQPDAASDAAREASSDHEGQPLDESSAAETLAEHPFDVVGLEFTDDMRASVVPEGARPELSALESTPEVSADAVHQEEAEAPEQQSGGLGFVVSYGVPLEIDGPTAGIAAEATSAASSPELPAEMPAETAEDEPSPSLPDLEELELVPQSALAPDVSTSITQEIVLDAPQPRGPQQASAPAAASVPVALQPASERADGAYHPPARPTVHSLNAVPVEEPRRKMPTPRIAGGGKAPQKSRAPLIGGIGAIIAAAATWYFTRGMF